MQPNYQRDEPSGYGDNKYLRYLGSCEEQDSDNSQQMLVSAMQTEGWA